MRVRVTARVSPAALLQMSHPAVIFGCFLSYRDLWTLKAIPDEKHVDDEKRAAYDNGTRVVTHDSQLRVARGPRSTTGLVPR